MKLPSIKQLRYLVALDEHRHFGHAARSCHISQSGFSIAIKELEELLNAQLIDRTSKSVTVTSLGRQVINKARLCLNEIENLVEIPADHQTPLSGKLTLGIIPTIAPYLLPDQMQNLNNQFPNLRLYLKERITPLLYDELLSGQIDLMLVALPYEFKHVEIMPLFKDNFLLAYHKDSKWLKDKIRFPEDLNDDSVLLLEDGHCLREHALSACKLLHTSKINQFSGTSLVTLLNMVNNDLGVTFVPEMARHVLTVMNSNLELLALDDNSYREIGLVWRKNSSRDNEFRMLGEFICSSRCKTD